jgi:3D (Asp-Asp-Asp) domain-containing protein
MFIARSYWRQLLATAFAAGGFVWLYEVTILDSRYASLPGLLGEELTPAPGATVTLNATAYCKGIQTASGVAVQSGVAAADPALLPLGSVIDLESPDTHYSGIYSILDTGPAVQGRELDIYMWSCHDALKFGSRHVKAKVLRLGWNPQATTPNIMQRLFKRSSIGPPPLSSRPLPLITSPLDSSPETPDADAAQPD